MKKSEERKVEPESGSSSTELPAWARKRKKVKPKSKGKLGSKQRAAKVRNKIYIQIKPLLKLAFFR
jgi:hypothetical protein